MFLSTTSTSHITAGDEDARPACLVEGGRVLTYPTRTQEETH